MGSQELFAWLTLNCDSPPISVSQVARITGVSYWYLAMLYICYLNKTIKIAWVCPILFLSRTEIATGKYQENEEEGTEAERP
jgi:hypothetical protein